MSDYVKVFQWIYYFGCFVGLAYMATSQIARYYENEDTSIIEFHKFTTETYPTYTLCFEDKEATGIYTGVSLKSGFSGNVTTYFDGRSLRHETSFKPKQDWYDRWTPNVSLSELKKSIGKPESMYIPMGDQGQLIVFNETYLIPPRFYKNLLKGLEKKTLKASTFTREIGVIDVTFPDDAVDKIEFGNATMHLTNFLEEYTTETTSDTTYGWVDAEYETLQTTCVGPSFLCGAQDAMKTKFATMKKESFPFVLSYQDPDRICYAPKKKRSDSNGIDHLTLDVEALIEHVFQSSGLGVQSGLPFLRIYIHMQGQLIRMLGRSVADLSLMDMLTEHCSARTGIHDKLINGLCAGTKIKFFMSQATLLKKRHDAIIPCNKDMKNEDTSIMTAVIKEVGCIPSFWKGIISHQRNISSCKSADDNKKIYTYASNVALSRSLIVQPCKEMIVVTNVVKESGRIQKWGYYDQETKKQVTYLDIAFVVGSEMFQEIDNLRAFGLESCWSGIGGFVGMFVGYSILQLPEFLAKFLEWSLTAAKKLF